MIRVVLLLFFACAVVIPTAGTAQLFVTPNKDKSEKSEKAAKPNLPSFVVPKGSSGSKTAPIYRTYKQAPPSVVYKQKNTTLDKEYEIFKRAANIDPALMVPYGRAPVNQDELMQLYAAHQTPSIASALQQHREMEAAVMARMAEGAGLSAKTQHLRSVAKKAPAKKGVFVPQNVDSSKPKRIFNNFR